MIAVMLINELMDQLVNNVGLKKKVAVFLAPKVDLVVQARSPWVSVFQCSRWHCGAC